MEGGSACEWVSEVPTWRDQQWRLIIMMMMVIQERWNPPSIVASGICIFPSWAGVDAGLLGSILWNANLESQLGLVYLPVCSFVSVPVGVGGRVSAPNKAWGLFFYSISHNKIMRKRLPSNNSGPCPWTKEVLGPVSHRLFVTPNHPIRELA